MSIKGKNSKNEGQFIFVNLFRMTSPGIKLPEGTFDYLILGSFDALKITYSNIDNSDINNLENLCQMYKESHISIPALYDKQPFYLFSYNDFNEEMFDVSKQSNHPLVMTHFQLDDQKIGDYSVEQLIDKFKDHIINVIQNSNPPIIQ